MNEGRVGWRLRAILVIVIIASVEDLRVVRPSQPYVVGAYYYGWYTPRQWAAVDYLGPHLPDPLEPALGEYDSEDPDVVAQHVRWAAEYGIDFLILSWYGQRTVPDRQALNHLLPALVGSTVHQAPMIELLSYGDFDLSSQDLRRRLTADVRYLGEHYLCHPSAMRIKDRPLLFFYLTRKLRGNVSEWVSSVRRELRTMGVEPFIVADEAFWQEANPERLQPYDAITSYNVYDWPLSRHRGWSDQSTFFADVEGLFARWRTAAHAAGAAFVPNIMPGYNDRGVRLGDDHFVIPRQTRADGSPTGFFEQSIDLAKRYTDSELRMVTITSFNEWHEWTQIEPTRRTGRRASASDSSAYTQGFPHRFYDREYLELIRDRLGDPQLNQIHAAEAAR